MLGEVGSSRVQGRPLIFAAALGAIALILAAPAAAFHTKNPSQTYGTNTPFPRVAANSDFDAAFAPGDEYYGFDPLETSVPYLAWRGEEVRLVKCITEARQEDPPDPIQDPDSVPAQWQILDWSGDAHVWPKFFDDVDQQTSSFDGLGEQEGRDCWAIDITSHKAGIAVVKMKVEEAEDEALRGDGDPSFVHQFTVIWMNLDRAILRNLEGGEGPPGGPVVIDAPSEDPENRLGVLVKGSVPLNEEFQLDYGLPSSIVLPDAWVQLSQTTLAHVSRGLQLANDGIEGNDNAENPTCDDLPDGTNQSDMDASNDNGHVDASDPTACDSDRGDPNYVPEPTHARGDFWDVHDSTGPFNSGVFGTPPEPNQPATVTDFCPDEEADTDATPKPDEACHVVNFQDSDCRDADDTLSNDGGHVNDTVDNCDEGEWEAFSRVFHDVSAEADEPTIGPFSPTRPDETLLSDSELTINDAPMPAALVLPTIQDDPDDQTDAVGSIGVGVNSVDKHLVYNRANAGQPECTPPGGDPENEHCVTAPFSGAYIPPSPTMESETADNIPGDSPNELLDDDRDTASGIHGSFANNFNGYLPTCFPHNSTVWDETGKNVCGADVTGQNDGLYHYWDTVDVFSQRIARDTECILFDDLPLGPGGDDRIGQTPSGPDQVALYTDEHGEAQFNFIPGLGFFFDELVDPNEAGGCDLQTVDTLGTADLVVHARYPFQPVTHAGVTSNVITKEIRNIFEKNLECQAKTGVAVATTICIVEIVDPFAPAEQVVCFETDPPRALRRFVGTKHDHEFNNEVVTDPDLAEFDICIRTDEDGLGAIEFTTGTGPVVVTASFVQEPNIVRQFPPPTQPPPTTTTTTTTTPPTTTTTVETTTPPETTTTQPIQVQTTQPTTTAQQTTTRPPTTTRRPTTTVKKKVKAKRKIKIKKKVKKVKRKGACIVRGRVVRPCVRGKG